MKEIKVLQVFLNERRVGTLAKLKDNRIAFEYDANWIAHEFSISPFSLPLRKGVFMSDRMTFDGLFGVFYDSLPDGWGRLLVDRMMLKEKINPYEISEMERLAIVADHGMGALRYQPTIELTDKIAVSDFDRLSLACDRILNAEYADDVDELFLLGGSSGGARPKILTEIDGEAWIIKFRGSNDPLEIGEVEYRYAKCAEACGVEVAHCKLYPSKHCPGYFGTKRFDYFVKNGKISRRHMISVSALLETSHRIPNLDYNTLMKVTLELTKSFHEVEKMYRLMCFNVFAHNRDDHSKNFSFLYNEDEQQWLLSPAYDLTFSNSLGGEHATCVNGNGANPCLKDLLNVALNIGFDASKARQIAEEIREIILEQIGDILAKYHYNPGN